MSLIETQHNGVTTGRWSSKPGRTTHTVYPIKYMVVAGTLGTGFEFYGPFDRHSTADLWARKNLHIGQTVRIERINYVRDEA